MFTTTQTTILGALLAMAPSAMSHMILANPVPFGSSNNSPLSPSGSDYPCKIGSSGSYEIKTMNELKVGEQQTLSFTGTAVHGGGSCQLAVTLDKEPTKSSVFKVIHSIEGGCPGVSGSASTFPWTVPSELPNGEATFAWTWFNKIGNREMYMDCAPITVSGGADDTSAFDALPDMALCNIGNGCTTVESNDYEFADPGKYVDKIGSGPFVGLTGGASNAGPSDPPADENPENPPAANPQNPPTVPSQSANDGLYTQAPASTQAPAQAPTQAPVDAQPPAESPQVTSTIRTLITVTAPSTPSKTAEAPAAPAPGSGNSNDTCTTDGELICNGEGKFGLCNHGKVVWQDVAAGTVCQNKAIAAAIPAKRDGLRHRALHRRSRHRRSDF